MGTHRIPPIIKAKNPQKHSVIGDTVSLIWCVVKSFPARKSTLSNARIANLSKCSVPGLMIRTIPANPNNIINQLFRGTFCSKKRMAPIATNIGIVCIIAEEIAREPKTILITNSTEEKSSQKKRMTNGKLFNSG